MTDVTGRGAWTSRGFPNGFARMYRRHVTGEPTGGNPSKDQDFFAVNRGVLAIQNLLNYNGYVLDYSTGPGIFGPRTDKVVRSYQVKYVPPADGIVGPNTMRALLRKLIRENQAAFKIPDNLLAGIITQESGFDPGAVGYVSPSDLGLVQINTSVVSITPDQAFDPFFALPWAAKRLAVKYGEYVSKMQAKTGHSITAEETRLVWDCTIASHNSPVAANQWFNAGQPPSERIANYVQNIRKFGLVYG